MDYRIIYVGAQTVFGILLIVLFFLQRLNRSERAFNKLDALYVLFFITIILDGIWMLIDGIPRYRSYHIALQVVYLSTMAFTGYLWLMHTLDNMPGEHVVLQRIKPYLLIPVIITLTLIVCSVKTNMVFIVDENGRYSRGDWHIFTIAMNYSYMLLGSYVALKCRKEASLSIDKRRYAVAALFPLPIFILSGAQILLPPGLPAMQGGVLIALLLLYGTTQNTLITRDSLTQLPNRVALERVLMDEIGKYDKSGNAHLYVMEGDIDNFKQINDTHGHPVGDSALQITAEGLRNTFSPYGAIVFRTGGDEFMVIVPAKHELDIDIIRRDLNEELAKLSEGCGYNLSMSLGMVEYDGFNDFKSMIEEADRELYITKKNHSDN